MPSPRETSGRSGWVTSTILDLTVRGLTPVILLTSIVVTFRGHNAPGGGFAGGLIMATVLVLRFLADGADGLRVLRVDPVVLIGAGSLLAVVSTAAPMLFGYVAMDAVIWKFDLPVIGELKVVTSAFFDLGVHILVLGGVIAMLQSLAVGDGPLETAPEDPDVASFGGSS
jgi:multisubunit Na+/H+ antiporter MnhB subunit